MMGILLQKEENSHHISGSAVLLIAHPLHPSLNDIAPFLHQISVYTLT
jgi:hypothetical protein